MQIFKDCGCGCKGKEQQKKFLRALILGVLFFIVANPELFTIMRKVFGYRIASATGYPTMLGLLLHALVFFLISWGLMNIPGRENMDGVAAAPSWSKKTSNVSPDSVMSNWTPTDYKGGAPPAPSSAPPVSNPNTLPAMPGMEQPYAGIGMPNTPEVKPMASSWDKMGKEIGGLDINSSSTETWQSCSLPNGTKIMVMH